MAKFEFEYTEIDGLLYPNIEIDGKAEFDNLGNYGRLRLNYLHEQKPGVLFVISKLSYGYILDVKHHLNIGFESSHVIPKRINNIFFFYLANGIQHCNKYNKEHTKHADCHTAPREHKINISAADDHALINQIGKDS